MDPNAIDKMNQALEADENIETLQRESRPRTLTEKGLEYHINVKTKNLKAKKHQFTKQVRSTLLLRGQNKHVDQIKQEFSKARVLLGEFYDIIEELRDIVSDHKDKSEIISLKEQIEREWKDFDKDMRDEIIYLENLMVEERRIEACSRVSSKSKKSSRSSKTKASSVKSSKLYLEQEQAALKVKLAYMEEAKLKLEQRKVEVQKADQEERLKKLRIHSEIAQNRAKLNVCIANENEDNDNIDLEPFLECTDQSNAKELVMKKFLDSVPSQPMSDKCDDQHHFEDQACTTVNQNLLQSTTQHPLLNKANKPQVAHNSLNMQENMLGKCLEKLVDVNSKLTTATLEQNHMNRKLELTRQLPNISIPVFNGDPLQYPIWHSSFDAFIDSKLMDAKTKLNFLNQFVTGKPKKIVEHFLLIGSEDAYKSSKAILHERYGNNNVISATLISKLEEWPCVGTRNADALRDFSDFLLKIKAAKATITSLDVLDFAKENVKILANLPYHIQSKWRDYIKQYRDLHGENSYPSFSRFSDFVKDCADKANIPELAELAKSKENPRQSKRVPFDRTAFSAYTKGKLEDKDLKEVEKPCLFCKQNHHLSACKKFTENSFKEKKNFFFKNHLCLGCASNGHVISNCNKRLKCKECLKLHPTCLHIKQNEKNEHKKEENGDKKEESGGDKENLSNCINVCSVLEQGGGTDNAMIVPVWVRHKNNPEQEILQYAILDDQSNVSFISKNLCVNLGVEGPPTELLLSTMQESKVRVQSHRIRDLEVLDYHRKHLVKLPMMFERDVIPSNRSQIPKPEVAAEWEHLRVIADQLMPYNPDIEISMLIGNNCPRIVRPREVIVGREDDPYGQRSLLGWGNFAFATKAKEMFQPQKVLDALELDFVEKQTEHKPYSIEDERFMRILENGINQLPDGHYEMPLPLKSDDIKVPNNRTLAVSRWKQLLVRFKKNPKYLSDYKEFMNDVINRCAERVPEHRLKAQDGKINYVPHTGIYHPKKPNQIRVVFDCSARYEGVSLNDYLLQGPDQINSLLGILLRFRQERVAFLTDIKGMFHQFVVSENYRDLLRFLWWKEGNPNNEVVEYRMKAHLFGAASSPGCANFGLRRAADDGEDEFGEEAAEFIRKDFYVDDGVKSVPSVQHAVTLIKASQGICAKAGLKLHKIISNSRDVLEEFPVEERATCIKDVDLKTDVLPIERALGMTWCVENDSFQFRIKIQDRPLTRRGILSTVGSIYDPNGYLAPVTLKGKQILQQMCRDKLDWDDPPPDDLCMEWEKWRREIIQLERLQIQRCFKPKLFGKIKSMELHHFSDASLKGYGQCSYIRLVNEEDKVHCSFVIGKARVTPLKQVTIPRLELTAATISARMSRFLRSELKYQEIKEYFWTDSNIVLGYVSNVAKRFHTYVANRVQEIRDATDPTSWNHIDTKDNPADDASRGLEAADLVNGCRWLNSPRFLRENGTFQLPSTKKFDLDQGDPEVKRAVVYKVYSGNFSEQDWNIERLNHVSSWYRARKIVALCLLFKNKLKRREIKKTGLSSSPSTRPRPQLIVPLSRLHEAEKEILRALQWKHFSNKVQALESLKVKEMDVSRNVARKRNKEIKKYSSLYRLDPFLDVDGLIRVGGRIKRANFPTAITHPIIIPRRSHIMNLLILYCHLKVNHMGRGITFNELRQRGYWINGGTSVISNLIAKCVTCKRFRGQLQNQKMSDLPKDRLQLSPPFSYCAVDFFGPFTIKEKRSRVKRYGVLFTCQASRSVHLETANSLTTSSFINALSRFLNRRGPVRQLRCDQGTNFVGARNELQESLKEMDQGRIHEYMLQHDAEWVPFHMNVPHASHMGGSWERMIRTVRNALEPLLMSSGDQLDDESFRTFITEVEHIVNSRPLAVNELSDPEIFEPLTPNHLLTLKPKVLLPPPGEFQRTDLYSKKWWRQVQYLTNEFWL